MKKSRQQIMKRKVKLRTKIYINMEAEQERLSGAPGDIPKPTSSTSAPPSTSANKTKGDAAKEKTKKKLCEKKHGSNNLINKDSKVTTADKASIFFTIKIRSNNFFYT